GGGGGWGGGAGGRGGGCDAVARGGGAHRRAVRRGPGRGLRWDHPSRVPPRCSRPWSNCHDLLGTEIPARELSNQVSEVLRRVDAREEPTLTVSGRPGATPAPARRQRSLPTSVVLSWPKAAAGLGEELGRVLPAPTDDESRPGP